MHAWSHATGNVNTSEGAYSWEENSRTRAGTGRKWGVDIMTKIKFDVKIIIKKV